MGSAFNEADVPNVWSFGQIIAVALLAVLFFAFLARCMEGSGHQQSEQHTTAVGARTQTSHPATTREDFESHRHVDMDSLMEVPRSPRTSSPCAHTYYMSSSIDYKRRRANELILQNTATCGWQSICVFLACSCWGSLAVIAPTITNYKPNSYDSSPPSDNMAEFWFTSSGYFWWMTSWYPVSTCLSVAIAIHLEEYYLCRRGLAAIPHWILVLFIVLQLGELSMFFILFIFTRHESP